MEKPPLLFKKYFERGQAQFEPKENFNFSDKSELTTSTEIDALFKDSLWRSSAGLDTKNPGQIICVAFYDEQGIATTAFKLGCDLIMKVLYMPPLDEVAHINLVIKNKFDQVVTSLGSSRLRLMPPIKTTNGLLMFELKVSLLLEAGNYSMQVRLGRQTAPNQGELIHCTDWLGPLTIHWDYDNEVAPFTGMVGLPASGTFKLIENGGAM